MFPNRVLTAILTFLLFLTLSACNNKESEKDKSTNTVLQSTEDNSENKVQSELAINIQVNDHLLKATLVDNSTTQALIELLSEGPITIDMSDYGSMEKVGALPESLPRNDEAIETEPGDLILYQGNSFVIYYDTNSWEFTRIGKISDTTQQELKEILGSGDVIVTLSLPGKE